MAKDRKFYPSEKPEITELLEDWLEENVVSAMMDVEPAVSTRGDQIFVRCLCKDPSDLVSAKAPLYDLLWEDIETYEDSGHPEDRAHAEAIIIMLEATADMLRSSLMKLRAGSKNI